MRFDVGVEKEKSKQSREFYYGGGGGGGGERVCGCASRGRPSTEDDFNGVTDTTKLFSIEEEDDDDEGGRGDGDGDDDAQNDGGFEEEGVGGGGNGGAADADYAETAAAIEADEGRRAGGTGTRNALMHKTAGFTRPPLKLASHNI